MEKKKKQERTKGIRLQRKKMFDVCFSRTDAASLGEPHEDDSSKDNSHDDHNNDHLCIFPPKLGFQGPCLFLKHLGSFFQGISPLIQLRNHCIPFQYFLYIDSHDFSDFIDLCLSLLHTSLGDQDILTDFWFIRVLFFRLWSLLYVLRFFFIFLSPVLVKQRKQLLQCMKYTLKVYLHPASGGLVLEEDLMREEGILQGMSLKYLDNY